MGSGNYIVALNWWPSEAYPSSQFSQLSPNWIWNSSQGGVIWDVTHCPYPGWGAMLPYTPAQVRWGASHHPVLAWWVAQHLWPQKAHIWTGITFQPWLENISLSQWHQSHRQLVQTFWPQYLAHWNWDPHILEMLGYRSLWDWWQHPISWDSFQQLTGVSHRFVYDSWCLGPFPYPIPTQTQAQYHSQQWTIQSEHDVDHWDFWWSQALSLLHQACDFLEKNQLVTTQISWEGQNTLNQLVWKCSLKAIEPTADKRLWKALLQTHFRLEQPISQLTCRIQHFQPIRAQQESLIPSPNQPQRSPSDPSSWPHLEIFLAHLKTQGLNFGYMDHPPEGNPLARGQLNPDATFWNPKTRRRRIQETMQRFYQYWKQQPIWPVLQWYDPPKPIPASEWHLWRVDLRYREWFSPLQDEPSIHDRFYSLALSPDHQWCWIYWEPHSGQIFLDAVWFHSPVELTSHLALRDPLKALGS